MKRSKKFIFNLFSILLYVSIGFGQIPSDLQKPCMPCEELKNLNIPDVVIIASSQLENPVHHCKVTGTIGQKIGFELLLPMAWNSRFAMGGGGGFVGAIHNWAAFSLNDGYATAGTDTGHKGNGYKGEWALNNAEAQLNFGYLAVHRTAVVSKEIIRQFYCSSSSYNYFFGCSRGGGQGMMEAQRYPNDFDGIVAGAPAFNWTAWGAELIQNTKTIYPDPLNLKEPVITLANLELLQKIVLEQCDSLDKIKDQILNDPRECEIDLDLLPKCPNNSAKDDCFTAQQIEAIKTVYAGVTLGEIEIYPGFPFGGENEERGWRDWTVGPSNTGVQLNFPSKQFAFGTDLFKYFIFNDPDWDYSSYEFTEFFKTTRFASSFLNATSTDYSKFKDQGGKLILYHGWSDPALSALSTIEHFEKAKSRDNELDNYIRLFLLPGVLHCGAGPGPSQTNWLELIRNWVEDGIAPDRVILTKTGNQDESMTRPVFPYPYKAVYDGKGDPKKESSFNQSTTTNKK